MLPLVRITVAVWVSVAIAALSTSASGSEDSHTALQVPAEGTIERLSDFPSRYVDPRHIEVWLPPGFDRRRRYAVLYMHDGQMLFDARTTWNRQAWEIDRVAARLLAQAAVRDFIIVAPWNNGKLRHAEYFPVGIYQRLPKALARKLASRSFKGPARADDYLKFLVRELKPAIDARFPTRPEREHTFLMGSSMGGLISVYALWEYPEVFGGAAALSTHWIGTHERNLEIPAAAVSYLNAKSPATGSIRLYMDRGTEELDALYDQAQADIDQALHTLGHIEPYVRSAVFPGAGHNEKAWSARLEQPLIFLLDDRRNTPR